MAAEASARLNTVRDWLSATVDRFNEAGLFFGHGSSNAHDEAVYLILHTLKLPLDGLHRIGVQQLAQLGVTDELAKLRLIDGQRLGAALGPHPPRSTHWKALCAGVSTNAFRLRT